MRTNNNWKLLLLILFKQESEVGNVGVGREGKGGEGKERREGRRREGKKREENSVQNWKYQDVHTKDSYTFVKTLD